MTKKTKIPLAIYKVCIALLDEEGFSPNWAHKRVIAADVLTAIRAARLRKNEICEEVILIGRVDG
jgi:hypothetical protein